MIALLSPLGGGSSLCPQATERAISHRASSRIVSLFEASQGTMRSITLCNRRRSASCASTVLKRSGHADGSSTNCANSTARQAANGRRAHHRCNVDGCPCRIDYSRAEATLIASSGMETSMSFLRGWIFVTEGRTWHVICGTQTAATLRSAIE